MAELPLEELLSAYLDGELSADEQDRAERLLADDPQARRLLDEFRGIGRQVRSLPLKKLPADFCQQVLRRAEQQMLAAAASPVHSRAASQAATQLPQHGDALEQQPWSERVRRPLVYAMLAVSLALVLMALDPRSGSEQSKTGSVAMQPTADSADPAAIAEESPVADERFRAFPDVAAAPNIAAPGMAGGGASGGFSTAVPSDAPLAKMPAAESSLELTAPATTTRQAGGLSVPGEAAGMATPLSAVNGMVEVNSEGLLIVECAVAPAALKNEAFQRVLSRQQVQWSYAAVDGNQQKAVAGGEQADRAKRLANAPDEAPVKLLYVEATPEQMEQTLAELSAQPENFPSVAVDPVAQTGRQLRWQNQYSRRAPLNYYLYNQTGQAAGGAVMESKADERQRYVQSGKRATREADESATQADFKKQLDDKQPGKDASAIPRGEPASQPADAAKSTVPPTTSLERNNLSRARSYAVPRENNLNFGNAPQPTNAGQSGKVANKPQQLGASPAQQQSLAGQALGAGGNVNRLRALFVLQLAEPADAEAGPAEATATSQPAAPTAAATSSPAADSSEKANAAKANRAKESPAKPSPEKADPEKQ
jgi:anti-sigma factor RsiW